MRAKWLIILFIFAGCNRANSFFIGSYSYEGDVSPVDKETGTSAFMNYKITIDSLNSATVVINGMQTDDSLLATIEQSWNQAKLFLKEDFHQKWRVSNYEKYRKDVPLLTLAIKENRLITIWGQIQPQFINYKSEGEYFSKMESVTEIMIDGPGGKSWMSQDASTEYDFGDSYGKGANFLNYNKQLFDYMGNPLRHIHRSGTFSFDGKTINCNFSDGQPPYKLEFKRVNGEWCVVDEYGEVLIWDDPAKREIK